MQRDRPWNLSPPLGLQGTEEHLALALASLPQPGLPPSLRREGSCRRCVVVGSGGVLYGSHLGSHIDQYDVIIRYTCQSQTDKCERTSYWCADSIPKQPNVNKVKGKGRKKIIFFIDYIFISVTRLNNAPVPGFERDAGSRTTIRLIYPEGAPHSANEYQKTTMVALVVFKSLDLDWLTSVITKQPLVSLHRSNRCTHKWCITQAMFCHSNSCNYAGITSSQSCSTSAVLFLIEFLVQNVVLEGGGGLYSPETRELQNPQSGDYSQDRTSLTGICSETGKCEF